MTTSLVFVLHIFNKQKVYEKRAGVYLEVPDDKMDDFKRSLAGLSRSHSSF